MANPYIVRLQSRSRGFIPARVIEGRARDARYWHQIIQPYIARAGENRLVDRNWNWPRLIRVMDLVERLAFRRTAYFQIMVQTDAGDAFPVGQVLVSDGFPSLPDQDRPGVFLWYLTAAPATALLDRGLAPDLKLLRPLVDVAIQFSYQRGYAGRLLLHAAASGDAQQDAALFDKYVAIGLLPVGNIALRIGTLRDNDGRYFYADEPRALDLSGGLDYLRQK